MRPQSVDASCAILGPVPACTDMQPGTTILRISAGIDIHGACVDGGALEQWPQRLPPCVRITDERLLGGTARANLQVVGRTMVIQASDNTEGRSLRPTTSVATGPSAYHHRLADRCRKNTVLKRLTGQKMPCIDPLTIEKNVNSPKDLAGIQRAKQRTPVSNVMKPATSILPNLSLNRPVKGRPNAIPFEKMLSAECNVGASISTYLNY
jgi:hypothetical protein